MTVDPHSPNQRCCISRIVKIVPESDVGKTLRARLKRQPMMARLQRAGRCPLERPSGGAFVASPNVVLQVAALTPHPVRQPRKSVRTRALSNARAKLCRAPVASRAGEPC